MNENIKILCAISTLLCFGLLGAIETTMYNNLDTQETSYVKHVPSKPLEFDGINDTYVVIGLPNENKYIGNWTHVTIYQYEIPIYAIKLLFTTGELDINWKNWHHIATDKENNLFIDGTNTSLKYDGNISNCWIRFGDCEYFELCENNMRVFVDA